jgi:hypothetical protein
LVQLAALALHQLTTTHRGRRLPVTALNVFNGSVGYRFGNGWRLELEGLNLLNSSTDLATYAYGSVLTTDSLYAPCYPTMKIPAAVCQAGIMDNVFRTMEPLAFRFTLGTRCGDCRRWRNRRHRRNTGACECPPR